MTLKPSHSQEFYQNLLEQLSGLIVVMDKESKFIYSNKFTAQEFGYQNEDSMLGVDAFGMRCPAVECADDFIKQDLFVRENNKELTILDIHTYAKGNPRILLTRKSPYQENNEIVGTVCHCVEVNSKILTQFCASMISTDSKYYATPNKIERSYNLINMDEINTLSQREQDCLFYLVRGKTMKQIAIALSISWRTVEKHIENIKLKWKCENKAKIVEVALARGYLTYIPQHILNSNISSPLYS